jgi:hypothetical protein
MVGPRPSADAGPIVLFSLVLVTLAFCGLAVANVRSVVGRRMLALHANERAAAALGVNVTGAKRYAFALTPLLFFPSKYPPRISELRLGGTKPVTRRKCVKH